MFVILDPNLRQLFEDVDGQLSTDVCFEQMKKKNAVPFDPTDEISSTRSIEEKISVDGLVRRSRQIRLFTFRLQIAEIFVHEALSSDTRHVKINRIDERTDRHDEQHDEPNPKGKINLLVEDVDQ